MPWVSMALRLISIDRETPMLMPPSIQEWVAEDDMARLVVDAVGMVGEHETRLNWRGSGSEQYPPSMMLALLIYCYANGVFSSRKIEAATYRDVAVRYVAADLHPDHDTIAAFRRENGALFRRFFVRVLALAREMKVLRLGQVALDGTRVEAAAAKARTKDRAELCRGLAGMEAAVEALVARAEQADRAEAGQPDGDRLPAQLAEARRRREQLREALERLDERCRRQAGERRRQRREFDREGPGEPPRAKRAEAGCRETINLTDPDARLLPQKKGGYAPSYNVQVAVQADTGAPLIVAAGVCDETNDRRQLAPMAEEVMRNAPQTEKLLADSGYDNSGQIYRVEQRHGVIVYCPPERRAPGAAQKRASRARQRTKEFRQAMEACLRSAFGRRSMRLRATTVEPVIGWIRHTLGFRRFHLRGKAKVGLEWDLVCLAFNLRLLHRIARVAAKPVAGLAAA